MRRATTDLQKITSDAVPYVPALRYYALTGLFDAFMRLLMRYEVLRGPTLSLPRPEPGDRVLGLGCGQVRSLSARSRSTRELPSSATTSTHQPSPLPNGEQRRLG